MNLTIEEVQYAVASVLCDQITKSGINLNEFTTEVELKMRIGTVVAEFNTDLYSMVDWKVNLSEGKKEKKEIDAAIKIMNVLSEAVCDSLLAVKKTRSNKMKIAVRCQVLNLAIIKLKATISYSPRLGVSG